MKKSLILFLLLLILNNCGFEFAYKTNKGSFLVSNDTAMEVSGDDASQLRVALTNILGDASNSSKYKLRANSTKTESAVSIKKDATASSFKIIYKISYELINLHKNCKIANKTITTESSYNSKSEGYSFSTDLSQKESIEKNINKNINTFLSHLDSSGENIDCI